MKTNFLHRTLPTGLLVFIFSAPSLQAANNLANCLRVLSSPEISEKICQLAHYAPPPNFLSGPLFGTFYAPAVGIHDLSSYHSELYFSDGSSVFYQIAAYSRQENENRRAFNYQEIWVSNFAFVVYESTKVIFWPQRSGQEVMSMRISEYQQNLDASGITMVQLHSHPHLIERAPMNRVMENTVNCPEISGVEGQNLVRALCYFVEGVETEKSTEPVELLRQNLPDRGAERRLGGASRL